MPLRLVCSRPPQTLRSRARFAWGGRSNWFANTKAARPLVGNSDYVANVTRLVVKPGMRKIGPPEGIRIGEEVDSKSIAGLPVAGSSPVPSASCGPSHRVAQHRPSPQFVEVWAIRFARVSLGWLVRLDTPIILSLRALALGLSEIWNRALKIPTFIQGQNIAGCGFCLEMQLGAAALELTQHQFDATVRRKNGQCRRG